MARAPLDVAVKAPPSPASPTPLDAATLVLLHYESHFRVVERTLRDFQHLERQLQLEKDAATLPSVLPAIDAYCGATPSFYPANQLGARLAVALETFLRQLVTRSELLATSLALKTFLDGNLLNSAGESYRDAVEDAFRDSEQWTVERVAAGCAVERLVAVEEKQVVLWKFASRGSGLVFRAQFASGQDGESVAVDPYSVGSDEVGEGEQLQAEVAHYRTSCDFADSMEDADAVYGHFVAEKSGAVTMQWENADMSSVMSKPLRLQVETLPLGEAVNVLEAARSVAVADSAEWLHEHVVGSEITALGDVPGWSRDEAEESFCEDLDDFAGEGPGKDSQIEVAVLEERTYALEAHVTHLEESLAASKRALKSALDRVQIAEEIYKANLETITQLESATAGGPAPKSALRSSKSEDAAAVPPAATLNGAGPQPEGASSELERVQRLCAGFQEQCLWRSVENVELETQLAASQLEASSWRERHDEQAAQLETLEQQNRTLRAHKKMLVQEVKRLQPFSQVNLAALVQEAQEARMVQRSLQAQLDSHEQIVGSGSADFVLVEASDESQP